jgi:GntR family histidine utilization transcriptional repressor
VLSNDTSPTSGLVMKGALTNEVGPLYQRLKTYVVGCINDGTWGPGDQIPSENELVRSMNVSRMTVNKALRELVNDGYLTRLQGVGTFVAEVRGQSHLVEIHNIADEVRQRQHEYSCKVLSNKSEKANNAIAERLQIARNAPVFHSVVVHLENQVPIQLEDRYVSPKVVPGYGKVDFSNMTPAEFLLKVAPLQKVEHTVKARMPNARIRKALNMTDREPCLVVLRRTWSKNKIASTATLYHPGDRYELTDQFKG